MEQDPPTTHHLRNEAQKIVGVNGGAPDDVTCEMTQVAIETSDVDEESMTQTEYDKTFNYVRTELRAIFAEVEER
jgi:uncharacterized protein YfdQ (DUF2303 family)